MIENKKIEMNVNMSGEDYLKYLEARRWKFPKYNKHQQQIILIVLFSVIGIVIAAGLLAHAFQKPIKPSEWEINARSLTPQSSWNQIGKSIVISFVPILIMAIFIAWIIHGVGFFIVKR
jgi:hypothetical protein